MNSHRSVTIRPTYCCSSLKDGHIAKSYRLCQHKSYLYRCNTASEISVVCLDRG